MTFLNLGILAHVDAGKTSLTERLLFRTGVIRRLGSVDAGTTQTDTLALEQQRGITIKSAVATFALDDVVVNLLDTPGHPDFIAEVERVLGVLDGAVLVVSAVEGVQAQTRVLFKALQRLRVPTLFFINKIDRRGAQEGALLQRIAEKLTPAILQLGATQGRGTSAAAYLPFEDDDQPHRARLIDTLTARDDAFLAACLRDDMRVAPEVLRRELAAQTRRAQIHPIVFGSAITGAGVDALLAAIRELLPTSPERAAEPVAGSVFKIERGRGGEKVAYVRLTAGALHVRDRVGYGAGHVGRVTGLAVFGPQSKPGGAVSGQIARVTGLSEARIGDTLGVVGAHAEHRHFAPPTLETRVVPSQTTRRSALFQALSQLTEQDPLINLRQTTTGQDIIVSLYGEVQKEVIQETLRRDFGLDAAFLESSPIHIERPLGVGEAVEELGRWPNPFAATVGLRIEPGPIDSGVVYRLAVELGSLPLSFHKAVEETARQTLQQGLHGWEVTDCLVTMTHSGFDSVGSTAGDFRNLTPLVLMDALKQAGVQVLEPILRFQLEIPADAYGQTLPLLARARAVPQPPTIEAGVCRLEGRVPVARVHELQLLLPGASRGEAVFEAVFDRYEPLRDDPPGRPRFDANPLDREQYLLQVVRRVSGRSAAQEVGDEP